MLLERDQQGSATVLRATQARLDAAVAIAFKDEYRAALATGDGPVVLDLSRVDFLDSSGLGALVAVMKHTVPARRFSLAGLTEPVQKVFSLTRMDSVFDIAADPLAEPAPRVQHG